MEENLTDQAHKQDNGFKARYLWFLTLLLIPLFFLIKPYITNHLSEKGFAYVENGQYEEAIKLYKKAIFLNNKDLDSMNWMAYCYKGLNDVECAIETYNKMLSIDPENTTTLLNLGLSLGLSGKREDAIPYFEKIRDVGPKIEESREMNTIDPYQPALRMLSNDYEKAGNTVKARDILLELLKNYPNDKNVQKELKEIESKLSNMSIK
jgi:tetratricopeptide (TPR) repeat protein